jgi:hypothetical protein
MLAFAAARTQDRPRPWLGCEPKLRRPIVASAIDPADALAYTELAQILPGDQQCPKPT